MICLALNSAPLPFLFSRHAFLWEKIKNLIVLDEVNTLGVKADEVCAVFSVIASNAGINTVEVGIGTVDAFPHGNTYLGHGD